MTLSERLHAAELASVRVYQQRSQIARQQMGLQQQAQGCDLELARLDGELRVLQALIDAEKASA